MKSEISTQRFSQLLSATPRGARLARLLAVRQLDEWGWPPGCSVSEAAALVVAELAANAVTHGRVRGRGFRLVLTVDSPGTLRIEVVDPRGDCPPLVRRAAGPADGTGRGLLLVEALAVRWGSEPWPPSSKAVWADIALARPAISGSGSIAQPATRTDSGIAASHSALSCQVPPVGRRP
ncbi:ATP-binding protein [Streptomyces sp. MK7]|uniref:ATP-binding protein n=1 Tax=Streptomyces sp. MK7 TaxID=3067635 RepID=UPI002931A783|nr:ATP-binding protein [Streptomyces sp. MK7]